MSKNILHKKAIANNIKATTVITRFEDLDGSGDMGKDGFSLTFRNGQRKIEFSSAGWKDRVRIIYDYEGNMGSSMLSMKNAHKLVNNISKIK